MYKRIGQDEFGRSEYIHIGGYMAEIMDKKKLEYVYTDKERKFITVEQVEEVEERIDHPSHYNFIPNVECIDVVEHMNFNLGNAVKYIWRAGKKPGVEDIEDLRKAIWYLRREIERLGAKP